MGKKRDPAPPFDWDAGLASLDAEPAAHEARERRLLTECWEIAYEFLEQQEYLDADDGSPVDHPPPEWMEMACSFVATGVWLGAAAGHDLEFIRHGGHKIAHRLRRLRRRLDSDPAP